jgi:LPXTG-site transpeptidase (sortase) family protein
MQRNRSGAKADLDWTEHAVVVASSLVWTAIVLLVLLFLWGFQDAQARWGAIQRGTTPTALAALQPSKAPPAVQSPTPWGVWHIATVPVKAITSRPTVAGTPDNLPPQVLPETPLEGLSTPTAPLQRQGATAIRREPTATPTMRPTRTPTSTPSAQLPGTTATRRPILVRVATAMLPPTRTPTRMATPTLTPIPSTPTPTVVVTAIVPTPVVPAPANQRGPDRLVISSIGIDTPVVPVAWTLVKDGDQEYSVWQVADYAAGWHSTSAPPGQPGNTVLTAHHNIKGEVFRYLADIQEGAEVDLYVGNVVYRYYVEQKMIVKEKGEPLEVRQRNAQWIGPTGDVRVTLVTCWPYTNNTHRVIVVAKPRS